MIQNEKDFYFNGRQNFKRPHQVNFTLQMDLQSFFADPVSYIHDICQECDQPPDFGLNQALKQLYENDPHTFDLVPLVTSPKQMLMYPPGQLLRLRIIKVSLNDDEYIFLRYSVGGEMRTPLISNEFIDGEPIGSPRDMVLRLCIVAQTIPGITPWLKSCYDPDEIPPSPHLTFGLDQQFNLEIIEPAQIMAKATFEISNSVSIPVDLIGFFMEASEMDSVNENFLNSLPVFVTLAEFPVVTLIPTISQFQYTLVELRQMVLNLFTKYMGELPAQFLLMWLMLKIQGNRDVIDFENTFISLNIFGCDESIENAIISFIEYICTAVVTVSLNTSDLNGIKLSPRKEENQFFSSPLTAANDTRLIIKESSLAEGKFQQSGIDNLQILHKLITEEKIDYFFGVSNYEAPVSMPVLILSNSRSILKPTLNVPIGDVNKDIQIDVPLEELNAIRYYIDTARHNHFTFATKENEEIIKEKIKELIKLQTYSERDIHTMMTMIHLESCSLGVEIVTNEIWDHSISLFDEVRKFKKQA